MSAESHHSITPVRTYLAVGVVLLVLTVITVTVSFLSLGGWNAVVAVVIATIKALLVALVFMHLLYDNKIFFFIFLAGLLFLSVLITFTMFDVLTRDETNPVTSELIQRVATVHDEPAGDSSLTDSAFDSADHGL